jgi:toxin CptA
LALYLVTQLLAWLALLSLALPLWLRGVGIGCCMLHALWVLPRHVLLSSPQAFCALKVEGSRWSLCRRNGDWQPVQLRPDSLALPLAVVLRFRLVGERRVRSLCIPRDALAPAWHRRLRVRLKFSRQRWAAPE